MSTAIASPPESAPVPTEIRRAASLLKLASEPIRAGILRALRDRGLETTRLIEAVEPTTTTTFNHHIRLMKLQGVIDSARIGQRAAFRLTTRGRALLGVIDALARD